MPRNPDTPCAHCGILCYPSKRTGDPTYIPPAEHICNQCRRKNPNHRANRLGRATTAWTCSRCGLHAERVAARGQRPKLCQECRPRGGQGWISRARRLALYERDEWTCKICNSKVDRNLIGTRDPRRPSLDHVTPYSLGGSNDEANLRLAHLACNVARGNRVAA